MPTGDRPTPHLARVLGLPGLTEGLSRVEVALQKAVETEDPFLTEVAGHLIGAGGKRVRPMVALCAGAVAAPAEIDEDVVTGAVAVELVHLGSLYHDDVIDEAATRRGVESVNARWSNIVAILAGDFLLARASGLAASLGTEIASILASTIGRLCTGQVLELQKLFDVGRDEATYFGAIEGKTASLFAASGRIGSIVAGHQRDRVEALTEYGRVLGVVFQIVDDVLDLVASDTELGKPAGLDLAEGIYTLPVIYALEGSSELRALLGRPLDADGVAEGRRLVCANGAVSRALAVAERHALGAEAALARAALDDGVAEALNGLCHGLIDQTRIPADS